MRQKVGNNVTKLGIALALALVACTLTRAQDVTTNSMPGTDFSTFHTYKWVAIEGATQPNQSSRCANQGFHRFSVGSKEASPKPIGGQGQTSLSAIRLPSIRSNSGTRTAWAPAWPRWAAGWERPQVPQSALALSSWICTTPLSRNSSGRAVSPRPSIPATTRRRNRRILTRPCRNC